ncbi:MAG: hypothetical protein JW873_05220 [Candidatus Saganbacteria bacterium]|nr:hypothetical protein [Candidatus Saganbacteria bacterium]
MDNMCVDPYAKVGGSSTRMMKIMVKNDGKGLVCKAEKPAAGDKSEAFVADYVNTTRNEPLIIAVIGGDADIEAAKGVILGDYTTIGEPIPITATIDDDPITIAVIGGEADIEAAKGVILGDHPEEGKVLPTVDFTK